jgi:hypothetical protein
MPKTHYHSSGKYAPIPLTIATLLALPACIWCGNFYGAHTGPETFTGLPGRIISMAFWTAALFLIFYLFKRYNHNRNARINVGIGVVLSLSSWATNWIFYCNMEMKGIHLVELVMVALPLSMMLMMNYYCEKCRQYYSSTSTFVLDSGKYYKQARQKADYDFLLDMVLDLNHLPATGPAEPKEIIKITLYYCDSCESNAIVDIDTYIWSQSSKHNSWKKEDYFEHRRHKDSNISRQSTLVQGAYLGDEAGKKLKAYLVG